MQRRQYSKKGQQNQHNSQEGHCIICSLLNFRQSPTNVLTTKILTQKYNSSNNLCRQAFLIEAILRPKPSSSLSINYRQALTRTKQLEMLIDYKDFENTVALIKPLILERTQKDRYTALNFSGHPYKIMMKRFLCHKKLLRNKPQTRKFMMVNKGSGISTDEEVYASPVKYPQVSRKPIVPFKQHETPQIRRLTRNLSNMIRKFQDNFEFHPSLIFDIMESAPGHILDITQNQKQQRFKRQLMDNISIISKKKDKRQKKPMERLNTEGAKMQRYDHYGFEPRGPAAVSRAVVMTSRQCVKKSTKKSRSKNMKQNKWSNDRAHTDYDCQIIKKQKRSLVSFTKQLISPLKSLSKNKGNKLASSSSRSKLSKKL